MKAHTDLSCQVLDMIISVEVLWVLYSSQDEYVSSEKMKYHVKGDES